ncbi:MAG: DUF1211 domain-containing protein [Clostridia bacterium]|nr:DUF1211 domain-containing protein [Clostridia bacterium]
MTKGRLEAFSDGVIAIIITITILLIDLPDGDDMQALMGIMPLVGCYLISFILVGTNWVNHHHLLQVARQVDGRILWANLGYLFILSFMPVGTGWVGRSQFAMLPVRVYVIINLASALSYFLLEKAIIRASGSETLKAAVDESNKELWTFVVEGMALAASFVQGIHYVSCPLLVVAMAPWIVPDLRMKRVFEDAQRSHGQKRERNEKP